jgi:hypothetical protein
MGFYSWLNVHDKSAKESKEREEALNGIADFAKTFDEWRNVFFRVPPGSVLEKTALLQMATVAKTFGQWLNVYQECVDGEPVAKKVALEQLMKIADDSSDVDWTKSEDSFEAIKLYRWKKIFDVSPSKSEFELRALRRIMELMWAAKAKEAEKKVDASLSKI